MVPVVIVKLEKLLTFSYFGRQIRNASDGRLVNRKINKKLNYKRFRPTSELETPPSAQNHPFLIGVCLLYAPQSEAY